MQTEEELFEQFSKLSPFERALLQLLSIIYEPAHASLVVNCLRRLELKNPRGNKPTTANLNHYFGKFEQLGFLENGRQCASHFVEALSKSAVEDGVFAPFAAVVQAEAPVSYYYGKWTTRCWRAMRELRIGIYTQQFDLIEDSSDFLSGQCREMTDGLPPLVKLVASPFDLSWFRQLPSSFQFYLLNQVFLHGRTELAFYEEPFEYLADESQWAHLTVDEQMPFKRLLLNELLLTGRLTQARELLASHPETFKGTGAQGSLSFLSGHYPKARQAFEEDLKILKEFSSDEKVAFFGPAGLFYVLTCMQIGGKAGFAEVASTIGTALSLFGDTAESGAYNALAILVNSHLNQGMESQEIELPEEGTPSALTVLFSGICQYWMNSGVEPDMEEALIEAFEQGQGGGYVYHTLMLADLLSTLQQDNDYYSETRDQLRETTGICPILSMLEPEEPWRRSLQALIFATAQNSDGPTQNSRLAWHIDFPKHAISVSPKEQKILPAGEWSKGRPISLSRLYQANKLTYLTSQDRKVCAAIRKSHNPDTNGVSYAMDMDKVLLALVGHPHLYLADSPTIPVEFVAGEPELLVEEKGSDLHIRFAQPISGENVNFFRETPTRVKIIAINDNHRRIAQITGKDGIIVPRSASEQVLTAIGNISSFMTVHSAIAVGAETRQVGNIKYVDADPTIYMHLLPYGTGFRLEMFVKPFADGGQYLKPGQGVENIMAEIKGRRLQTKRNLALEEQMAQEIEELCPILDLATDMEQENDREWHLHDPDDCLQALLELQGIRDLVVIEWPEGEKLTITHRVGHDNLNLKIRTNRQNWFAMSGQLKLDQDRVIELKELLIRVKKAPGRFVEIAEGQFIALTQEFRKRLDDLNMFSEKKGDGEEDEVFIHPLAALHLEKLTKKAKTSGDEGWRRQLSLIKEAQDFKPQVPSTLRAELRSYQREGFEWLARLAHWGVGGCLADDMGLGKTLQSLATLLSMAQDGPSLVVAPTSVCSNWQTEVRRFTPTINIRLFTGKDREESLQGLGKYDLVITTYTLLQQESELLSTIAWQTVILDEAQAIKNSATKRSQAAMALNARFKLITTGTPIENHLGELWNLFHFINPGLLGTLNSFNDRFAIPIERYQDRKARIKLKKLIRPFILRRIKSQVLEELPSRTEVTLDVEMSQEETLFYEALRQNAIDVLESSQEKKGRHLQILTEIMRLRQACCNPRLIDANTSLESSKLQVFGSLVEDLLPSGHKALVFSQFIGHLSIIREYLDAKGIKYQYLDGATSAKLRKQRVDAFQAGKGELFLISLKAGGLGLNLTAADYVIHMDPWWNPAIEDQASDRAHRIGQTRPVTIYRLVCQNTIEEKIVKLHQEKRDLADSLLEGSDVSARMSSDDLFDLIRTP